MARTRKRTKEVQDIVSKANAILRNNKVKDRYDDNLARFLTDYLLSKNMYEGYTFYKETDGGGLMIAGTHEEGKYDCIQFF